MAGLLDRRFLFVIGKGGVGKTTVAAAIASAAAARGKRTLLAMTNTKERLSQILGTQPIGPYVTNVAPNFDAVSMTPQVALEEYGTMVLRVKALYKAIFENKLVRAFLRGTPGIEAWSMLGKAFFHASPPRGEPEYDLVIVDAPATGHGLDMLRVPDVIVNVAPPGLLRAEAERALAMFRDPSQSAMVLVSLPEDMPANETIELHAALTKELRMPIGAVVVNGVLPTLFADDERERVESLPAIAGDTDVGAATRAARARSLRERVQAESIALLRARIPAPFVELPYVFSTPFGRAELDALAQHLATRGA